MPIVVTHAKVSNIADSGNSAWVEPSDWNAQHEVSGSEDGTLFADVADQVISGGATVTSLDLGTVATGTLTIEPGRRPQQFVINDGAFTLAAPAVDGNCMVLVTNGASAGTITFSGFSMGSTGAPLDTVDGHRFTIFIWRVAGACGYQIVAHQ